MFIMKQLLKDFDHIISTDKTTSIVQYGVQCGEGWERIIRSFLTNVSKEPISIIQMDWIQVSKQFYKQVQANST